MGRAKQQCYDTCEVIGPLKPKEEKNWEGGSKEMVIKPK